MSYECVILFRNPSNGSVGYVADEKGELAVFDNLDAAIEASDHTPVLRVFPFQIVELDEL